MCPKFLKHFKDSGDTELHFLMGKRRNYPASLFVIAEWKGQVRRGINSNQIEACNADADRLPYKGYVLAK